MSEKLEMDSRWAENVAADHDQRKNMVRWQTDQDVARQLEAEQAKMVTQIDGLHEVGDCAMNIVAMIESLVRTAPHPEHLGLAELREAHKHATLATSHTGLALAMSQRRLRENRDRLGEVQARIAAETNQEK